MENSGIEWTDNTFNPWWGCTQIAPGCDNCYAKELDMRFSKGANWGPHNKPRRTGVQNWNKVLRWNKTAEITGKPIKVFCASMADICDKNADPQWREDLWNLIRSTPNLIWQLLTKRSMLIETYIPADILQASNVWMGVSVENREFGLKRIADLIQVQCSTRWLSVEPLLEEVIPSFADMQHIDWMVIGDSFFAPGRTAKQVTDAAKFWKKTYNKDWLFRCRTRTENGIEGARCWRLTTEANVLQITWARPA